MVASTLANLARPKRFSDVMGQDAEVEVLKKIVERDWSPPLVLITGPFGTGKTTLAKLLARAKLCQNRNGVEPCGTCDSCQAIDRDNHPAYHELDAASHGQVADVRGMKDQIIYSTGYKNRIVCYDEAHMVTPQGQNSLLQVLEEGQSGVIFIFASTEHRKILPTIRSRSIELNMKLLTAGQIAQRLKKIAEEHSIDIEDRAIALISSYVRGHMRDAIMLLEQLHKMTNKIEETAVRTYLRLDKQDFIYKLLIETEAKTGFMMLEQLLCEYSAQELCETIGEVLIEAYKLRVGIPVEVQVDRAWLRKVTEVRGNGLLDLAEAILTISTDFSTINLGLATIGKVLYAERNEGVSRTSVMMVNGAASLAPTPLIPAGMRKPAKETTSNGADARL